MNGSIPYRSAGGERHAFLNTLVHLERTLCNAVCGAIDPGPNGPGQNIFGRPTRQLGQPRVGECLGMAAAGQRVAVFLERPDNLPATDRKLAVDRQLPLVVHAPGRTIDLDGWIIIQALDAPDAGQLTVLAHAVAEQTLTPVWVISDRSIREEIPDMDVDAIRSFLGAPEEIIPSPSPWQEMVFGPRRRRIPSQFSFDQPVLRYAQASTRVAVRSTLARQAFYRAGLEDQIARVETSLSTIFERVRGTIHTEGKGHARDLLVSQNQEVRKAFLASGADRQAACLSFRLLQPFPWQAWKDASKDADRITVIRDILDQAEGWAQALAELSGSSVDRARRIEAQYASPFTIPTMHALMADLKEGHHKETNRYIDLSLVPLAGGSGQKEVLRDAVIRNYPDINDGFVGSRADDSPALNEQVSRPLSLSALVREQADQGQPYSRLSRFYHDVILKEDSGVIDTDPFHIQGVIPPLTELLRTPAGTSDGLARLDPGRCTGCGSCLVQCPYGAMPSLAIGLEGLLRASIQEWGRRTGSTSTLTPLVKNLATFWTARLQAGEANVIDQGETALAELLDQMSADTGKRESVLRDWSSLKEMMGSLPWAVTDLYYSGREQQRPGSGELFTIAIDPHACTACGICVEACPTDALSLSKEEEATQLGMAAYSFWESLPDTSGETIRAMHVHPESSPLSALMLSRHHYQCMVGGQEYRQLAPTRMILHTLTALLESRVQPMWQEFLVDLAAMRQTLDELALGQFQQALPDRMSADLERVVDEAGDRKLTLDEMLAKLQGAHPGKTMDATRLSQWIHTGKELALLEEALRTGTTGGGRSRYGIILAGELGQALVQFPFQPFQVPVWVESDPDLDRIQGILAAQQQGVLDQVRLLRLADLQIKQSYRPELHDDTLNRLAWADLTEKEKRLLPPLLFVIRAEEWMNLPLYKATRLLAGDMPVKVVVIRDQLAAPNDSYARQGWLLPWLTSGQLPVVQTSPSRMDHFSRAVQGCLATAGPALISVLGCTGNDTPWMQQAEEWLVAGLFPLVMAMPRQEHHLLSEYLQVEAVPEPGIPPDSLLPAHVRAAWEMDMTNTGVDWAAILEREWHTWLELAGRIKAGQSDESRQIRDEMTVALTSQQQALEGDYQRRMAELKASFKEEVRVQLADRLYHLSRMKRENRDVAISDEHTSTTS